MNSYWKLILIFAVAPVLMAGTTVFAAPESSVSFTQENFDGTQVAESQSSPPSGLIIDASTLTSDFRIESSYSQDPLTLRTTTGLEVLGRLSERPNRWKTIEAMSGATSALDDLATVQGVPGGTSGTVEFVWQISGTHDLLLENVNRTAVSDFSSLVTLVSTIPGFGGDLFTNLQTLPSGATGLADTVPISSTLPAYPVGFQPGQTIPVRFELSSELYVMATSNDFGTFHADLAGNFGNSATLQGVTIFDANGIWLPDARLTSSIDGFVYPATVHVPEANTVAIWLLLCSIMSVVILRGRGPREG